MTIGSKYVTKYDNNPAVGAYDPQPVKPRIKSAVIKEEVSPYRRPLEVLPSPGTYDKHLIEFGKDAKSFKIGEKFSEKYD